MVQLPSVSEMFGVEKESTKCEAPVEERAPKMESVFRLRESPFNNLAQQLKTATPQPQAKLVQQRQDALSNTRQTLQGVAKQQGNVVKQGKTDPNNPIPNTFVVKPDGSADVLDSTTGQLKPVPGLGGSKPVDPMKNTGVMGT
jgi:hypothetical protein